MGPGRWSGLAQVGSRDIGLPGSTSGPLEPNIPCDEARAGVARLDATRPGPQGTGRGARVGPVRRRSDDRSDGHGPGGTPASHHRRIGLSVVGPSPRRRSGRASRQNRSPGRTSASTPHSSVWRTPGRGSSKRRGFRTIVRTTRMSASSKATVIGRRMPNVCTDRQRSKSMPSVTACQAASRTPRMRSRRVAGTSIVHAVPRDPRSLIRRTARG